MQTATATWKEATGHGPTRPSEVHPIRQSISELYEDHAEGLLAFFTARTRDAALAEDLLQDLFLSLQRKGLERLEQPRAYLYRAAANLVMNAQRDRSHARRALEQAARCWAPREGADPYEARAAMDALQNLPREQAEIVALRVYGGLSFQEIAGVLEKPLPTVHRWHHEALAQLRQVLSR